MVSYFIQCTILWGFFVWLSNKKWKDFYVIDNCSVCIFFWSSFLQSLPALLFVLLFYGFSFLSFYDIEVEQRTIFWNQIFEFLFFYLTVCVCVCVCLRETEIERGRNWGMYGKLSECSNKSWFAPLKYGSIWATSG